MGKIYENASIYLIEYAFGKRFQTIKSVFILLLKITKFLHDLH
jgi:hypothetical protein